MSYFEATYMSRMSETQQLSSSKQAYKATDLDDALKQHERCNQIMRTNHPEYECNLVVMGEITDEARIEELKKQFRR